jgi:glycosyl-4,4'-diaponeurosporenoate acyltransferase
MKIIHVWAQNDLLLDVFIWLVIHLSIGFCSSRIPISWFNPDGSLYRAYHWEMGGLFYQHWFRVRSWKRFLPFGGHLYPNTFSLQTLPVVSGDYLDLWIKESCRSEFCHWMMIWPGFLFFFWNPASLAFWMVIYAVANNFFPIVVQRFNRPRMRYLADKLKTDRQIRNTLYPERIYSSQHE